MEEEDEAPDVTLRIRTKRAMNLFIADMRLPLYCGRLYYAFHDVLEGLSKLLFIAQFKNAAEENRAGDASSEGKDDEDEDQN